MELRGAYRTQSLRGSVKYVEEIMKVLERFGLAGSCRDAAKLAGCSPNVVIRYVAVYDAGVLVMERAVPRPRVIDGFTSKSEELVDRLEGEIRADVAHKKIVGMEFFGLSRTGCRVIAQIKQARRVGRLISKVCS